MYLGGARLFHFRACAMLSLHIRLKSLLASASSDKDLSVISCIRRNTNFKSYIIRNSAWIVDTLSESWYLPNDPSPTTKKWSPLKRSIISWSRPRMFHTWSPTFPERSAMPIPLFAPTEGGSYPMMPQTSRPNTSPDSYAAGVLERITLILRDSLLALIVSEWWDWMGIDDTMRAPDKYSSKDNVGTRVFTFEPINATK